MHFTVCSSSLYFISFSRRILQETLLKSYWDPGRQYLLFFPHLPGQLFHHRRLSGWSSMSLFWWIHADYSWWFSCPYCAWMLFPGLVAPSPSQRSMWLAYSSLDHPSSPFWRQEWCLLRSVLPSSGSCTCCHDHLKVIESTDISHCRHILSVLWSNW